jgi:phosphodiesterase/alkaline phosphatase D-like protein
MFDDHEIFDNYQGYSQLTSGGYKMCFGSLRCFNSVDAFNNGIQAYQQFLHGTNPSNSSLGLTFSPHNDSFPPLYYDFVRGDVAFMVYDDRSYRSLISMDYMNPAKTMMGSLQLQYVFNWLLASNVSNIAFKVLVSPACFTNFIDPFTKSPGDDGYANFPIERKAILDFIETNSITNVFIVSGDLHTPFVAQLRRGIYEFSTSPMGGFATLEIDTVAPVNPQVMDPDLSLDWFDGDTGGINGYPSSFISTITLNTSASPATLLLKTYRGQDQSIPVFSQLYKSVGGRLRA